MEAVAPHFPLQFLNDACGVIFRTLDEQWLALVPETDHAGSLPLTEMADARVKVGMWLEAEAACVLDGAEN